MYSTILSGIWLGVAPGKPHYGNFVTDRGPVTPHFASVFSTAVAKTIEISFIAMFITFLGQFLSQKALRSETGGISIADMQLRTLVSQPGTLITHYTCFIRTWKSLLGLASVVACISAMLYTTASDALGVSEFLSSCSSLPSAFNFGVNLRPTVSPNPSAAKPERRIMQSLVQTSFANDVMVDKDCPTPINTELDGTASDICIAIEHSGQALVGSGCADLSF